MIIGYFFRLNEKRWDSCKPLRFSHDDGDHESCILSSCLAYIAKITGRTRDKTNATPVLRRNRVLEGREFNFVNRFKGDFKAF